MTLRNKVLFISGGSRGIGRAIALRAARDGAKIAIAAKTAEPHARLPGTIYTTAREIEEAGGTALPIQCDLRDEVQVERAIEQTVATLGSLDILINNASAISLTNTENTTIKKYDLMQSVNGRGTFIASKLALPHLKKSSNPHILTLSPPLSLKAKWFGPHTAYSIAKYNMSLCVLGMAEEFRPHGIAVNALWPRTAIQTAALNEIPGWGDMGSKLRKDTIMADAAWVVLNQPSKLYSGHFTIDDDVLRSQGVTDLDHYSVLPGSKDFLPDFFLDDDHAFTPPPKQVL